MIKNILIIISFSILNSNEYKFYECYFMEGRYHNPVWSDDSQTFAIEKFMTETDKNLTDEFAFRIHECGSDENKIERLPGIAKSKKKKKKTLDPNKYRQEPIGWINHEKSDKSILFSKLGRSNTVNETYFSKFPESLSYKGKKSTKKKRILNSSKNQIYEFITIGNYLYFLSRNDSYNVFRWKYSIPDLKQSPERILESDKLDKIPITSFDVSKDYEKIIIIQHFHNSSEINVANIVDDYYMDFKSITLPTPPDAGYMYSNPSFAYNNNNKFIVMAVNMELDLKNSSSLYLMDIGTNSSKKISNCYKHKSDSNKHITNSPTYQWHPETSDIFFVTEQGVLNYWSEYKIFKINLNIDSNEERIKLFQISPNSKYMIIATTKGLYVYEMELK